ncbi:DUF4097 family beta strand repeat-containing protein [Mediterraneibacter agrestimuris]|uniref:DUF4097 family beta strand repeat-containing protein n=1 Tax=Mediterraneibacter agrestimuris TaxID=2941333 RepID=UPI00203DDEF8|nr:DUF4097 family beta strand repeat-containing protein [Mediterraneibacter agrestimuris]
MKTLTKRILAVSAITAGAGLAIMGIGMGLGGHPGVVFSSSGIRSSYEESEPYFQKKMQIDAFSNLDLNIDSEADIQILPSDDNKYYVEYLLHGDYSKPVCKVANDTLTLSQTASREHVMTILGFNFRPSETTSPYITLYLPEDTTLKQSDIYNDYGIVEVSGLKSQAVSIDASYGNIILDHISAKDMKLKTDTGTILADALKADKLSVVSEYGSAEFKESVLGNADFQMDDGDLVFDIVKSDSLNVISEDGNIHLKDTSCKTADFALAYGDLDFDAAAMDSLDCTMEYGSLNLSLPVTIQNYQLAVELEYGDLSLPEDALLEHYQDEDGEVSYHTASSKENTEKIITIRSQDGNVNINYR